MVLVAWVSCDTKLGAAIYTTIAAGAHSFFTAIPIFLSHVALFFLAIRELVATVAS